MSEATTPRSLRCLAVAQSHLGSDSPLDCHSLPRCRFATPATFRTFGRAKVHAKQKTGGHGNPPLPLFIGNNLLNSIPYDRYTTKKAYRLVRFFNFIRTLVLLYSEYATIREPCVNLAFRNIPYKEYPYQGSCVTVLQLRSYPQHKAPLLFLPLRQRSSMS